MVLQPCIALKCVVTILPLALVSRFCTSQSVIIL